MPGPSASRHARASARCWDVCGRLFSTARRVCARSTRAGGSKRRHLDGSRRKQRARRGKARLNGEETMDDSESNPEE
eukprot:7281486-Lingulodinium_polyedra.AAC.1